MNTHENNYINVYVDIDYVAKNTYTHNVLDYFVEPSLTGPPSHYKRLFCLYFSNIYSSLLMIFLSTGTDY